MGLFSAIKNLSRLFAVALVLLLVASLFCLISVSTTAWFHVVTYSSRGEIDPKRSYQSHGLWRVCVGTLSGYQEGLPGECSDAFTGTAQDFLAAVQALVCLGLMGLLLALLLIGGFIFGKQDGDFVVLAAIICIVSGALYLIGVIVHAAKVNDFDIKYPDGLKLGWSFGLSVVAAVMEIVSGSLFLVDRRRTATPPSPPAVSRPA